VAVAVDVGHEELALDLREELVGSGVGVVIIERAEGARDAAGFSLFISRLNVQPWRSLRCASAIGAELRAAGHAPSRYHAGPGAERSPADPRNGVHFFDELAGARAAGMAAVVVEAGPIVSREERRGMASAISGGVRKCLL
jgi:N-acetylmuramoyl-L-alanine amidase